MNKSILRDGRVRLVFQLSIFFVFVCVSVCVYMSGSGCNWSIFVSVCGFFVWPIRKYIIWYILLLHSYGRKVIALFVQAYIVVFVFLCVFVVVGLRCLRIRRYEYIVQMWTGNFCLSIPQKKRTRTQTTIPYTWNYDEVSRLYQFYMNLHSMAELNDDDDTQSELYREYDCSVPLMLLDTHIYVWVCM